MPYKYNRPPSAAPSTSRNDIEIEFKRWNDQAGSVVITDYQLPMDTRAGVSAEVEFLLRGQRLRVKIDQWPDFRTNLRCCYLNIRDMRLAEARGSLESLRETLTMLPAGKVERDPYELLGVRPDASTTLILRAYQVAANELHPDKGGTNEAMAELNAALDRIKAERGLKA